MPTTTDSPDAAHTLQCMEIWNGNAAIQNAVSVPGLDVWIRSRPYQDTDAGGDLHYVSQCAMGKISRLSVADVSGHGGAVAEVADWLRKQMRHHINTPNQAAFARAMNEEFTQRSASGQFATALLATYFAPKKHLIITNAGHPRPLWYRADLGAWQLLDHESDDLADRLSNLPLGVIEPTDYHQFAAPLTKGDIVIIYTDSLIEAAKAGSTESGSTTLLGEAGLIQLAAALDIASPDTVGDDLLHAVAAYAGNDQPDDDETVLVLHHNAVDPPHRGPIHTVKMIGRMMGIGGH